LGGHLLAGAFKPTLVREWIVGYDAVTGQRYFRIKRAGNPVVIGRGNKVAFLPGFRRDKFRLSVWMRTASGIEKIVQFHNGRGTPPGIPVGFHGEGVLVDLAFDRAGRRVAVAFGNENLRLFDVWVVDVATGEPMIRTRNHRSHSPSLSPNGERLAVRTELAQDCGTYLVGKIRVFSTTSDERRSLTSATCDRFYDTPRWIDNDSVLAVRVTRTAPDEFDTDIVSIDATTGAVTDVVTDGNPCCITVSPSLGLVAYSFTDADGFSVLELGSGAITNFSAGTFVPHLAGENRSIS
jgi:hypothetical protein